ncbi:hypothetical protein FRC04_004968 [Tulasnella sp. 424]|nr:hypothetical protein FRC04_004968 [Tulasnella sp. 424]KAG8970171.1 hypothetical protein FRC05_000692 [Tulasnella sp. 425]
MTDTTESAPVEGIANLTLQDEVEAELSLSEEESDESGLDGYLGYDEVDPEAVKEIHSKDRDVRLQATIKIRRFLGSQEAVIQSVVDSGILPTVIEMLSWDDPEFLIEAILILINITAGTSEQTSAVIDAGALPKLLALFPSSPMSGKEDILLIFGNVLGDSEPLRQVGVRAGGIELALDVLRVPDTYAPNCIDSAAWVVAAATNHGKFPDDDLATEMISVLTTFLQDHLFEREADRLSEAITETIKALRQLSVHHDVTTAIHKHRIIHRIVQLCTTKDNHRLREDALGLISRTSCGGEECMDALMDAGCLDALETCITEHARSRSKVCSAVVDIARGTPSHVKALIKSLLLPHIFQVLLDAEEADRSRLEAARVMLSLAETATIHTELLDPMVDRCYVETLSRALLSDESEGLGITLQAIEQILNTKWDGRQRILERFTASDGPHRVRNTEDIGMETVENRPDQDESDNEDEEVDESVLDGYLTEEKHIAPEIVNAFRSNDRDVRLEAAKKLKQLGDKRETLAAQEIVNADKRETLAAQEIVNAGLLPSIVEMMSSDDIQSQVRATGLVALVTASESEQTSAAVEAGVIPRLITLASSMTSKRVRNNSLLAMGNIGKDSQQLRDKLIQEGGLKPPLDVLANPSKYPNNTLSLAADTIHGCNCSDRGKMPGYEVIRQVIPVLLGYILYQRNETSQSLHDCLVCLSHILEDESQVDDILRNDVVPRLVHLCTSQEAETRHNALQCVTKIIRSSVDGTEKLINAGILPIFKTCIEGSEQDRRLACFGASNLVVGTLDHARAFMGLDVVPIFVKLVSNEEEVPGIRNDAAWTLSNLALWGREHHDILDTLLEANVVESLCIGLTLEKQDEVEISLQGIQSFFRPQWEGQERAIERIIAGDGIDQLRALRARKDLRRTQLPRTAQTLLESHFPDFRRAARV